MTDFLVSLVMVIPAVGCGLVAGLLFAFSTSVMPALGRLPAAHGIEVMQSVNTRIQNPVFGLLFLGTTVACLLQMVSAAVGMDQPAAFWQLIGGLLFVVGTVMVTLVFNLPLNNTLARVDPASAEAERLWEHFLARWTTWNHVRTLAATGSATVLTLALRA
jgi:uncharacterized membrane protein